MGTLVARRLNLVRWCTNDFLVGTINIPHNAVDRTGTDSSCRISSSSVLHSLHWLPVQQRIQYNLSLITLNIRYASSASYLNEILGENTVTRFLRFAAAPTLFIPPTRYALADRAFSVSSARSWKSLPAEPQQFRVQVHKFKEQLIENDLCDLAFC